LLHTILHRTDVIIFPLPLQTIIIAPMMSIWGKGGKKETKKNCESFHDARARFLSVQPSDYNRNVIVLSVVHEFIWCECCAVWQLTPTLYFCSSATPVLSSPIMTAENRWLRKQAWWNAVPVTWACLAANSRNVDTRHLHGDARNTHIKIPPSFGLPLLCISVVIARDDTRSVGHGSWPVTHWPISQWLSQSNFKNNFDNFGIRPTKHVTFYCDKFVDIHTSYSFMNEAY